MRFSIVLAVSAGLFLCASAAHASWQSYYPPVHYHPGYAYPSNLPPVITYSYPGAYGGYSSYGGRSTRGHSWFERYLWRRNTPPPPPGSTWHPWVRSPRDFFMMER